MIDAEIAAKIEEGLAKAVGVRPDQLRDYFRGGVRADGQRRTGIRFVRGTHSGTYIRDPEGTDVVPAGYEEPPY
jgi:hypothetical protein